MCSVEQALPYIALAVLCPGAYEAMARSKVRQLFGASKDTAFPHRDPRSSNDPSDEQDQ